MRRLMVRNRGRFPPRALIRIWREIISATISLEGPFTIAVYDPGDGSGCWDHARDHFGTETPAVSFSTCAAVLKAVRAGDADVGIVPVPGREGASPWWMEMLAEEASPAARVVALLPFLEAGNSRGRDSKAFVLASAAPEASKNDRSILGLEVPDGADREAMVGVLREAGFEADILDRADASDGADAGLADVTGFVGPDDPRLARLREAGRFSRVVALGSYAVTVDETDLAALTDEAARR